MVCSQGHSFDRARSGYLNLLQPQDRRSRSPGDTSAAIAARRLIHQSGVTQPILQQIGNMLAAAPEDVVLDVGSGEGFYLGSLAAQSSFQANGLDISLKATDAAAKKYPHCEWIVANADRFLPYADHSFSKVLSLTSRLNAAEFHRTLQEDGRLLLALPAAGDLLELRGHGHDRTQRTIQALSGKFKLIEQRQSTTTAALDRKTIEALLLSIYRPLQNQPAQAQSVTFSLDLLLFQRA